jgi:hypothetical protein
MIEAHQASHSQLVHKQLRFTPSIYTPSQQRVNCCHLQQPSRLVQPQCCEIMQQVPEGSHSNPNSWWQLHTATYMPPGAAVCVVHELVQPTRLLPRQAPMGPWAHTSVGGWVGGCSCQQPQWTVQCTGTCHPVAACCTGSALRRSEQHGCPGGGASGWGSAAVPVGISVPTPSLNTWHQTSHGCRW